MIGRRQPKHSCKLWHLSIFICGNRCDFPYVFYLVIMKKVIVIGGGIVGEFTAYYLSQAGYSIMILDDKPTMPSASAGNCGLIRPSKVYPLNSWATLFQGIKWLGKKDAPLYIRPQLDVNFLKWFLSFTLNCRKASVKKAAHMRNEILQSSWRLYEDFFKKENSCAEWTKNGILYACKTPEGMESLCKDFEHLNQQNLNSVILDKQQLMEKEPLINEDIVGGGIIEVDGWLNPGQLLQNMREINQKNGVTYTWETARSLVQSKGKITSVKTEDNEWKADQLVLCAGAKSVALAKTVGISLPILPGKGYHLTTQQKLEKSPERPVFMMEKKVVATPWQSGFRVGSTMEFTGYDLSLNTRRIKALKEATTAYMKIDINSVEWSSWAGWRPMTPNGVPIIRKSKKYANLILATGHGMLGLSMAPATGAIVKNLIQNE